MKPNPDLPTESNPEQSDRIAAAIVTLLERFYPRTTAGINGAQIIEMLDAVAKVASVLITNTGQRAPDFDRYFLGQLAKENLINTGQDPDAE